MSEAAPQSDRQRPGGSGDFSLVLGGPLFQLFRRCGLTGDALELVRRRVVVVALFAWLPLLVLAMVEGRAMGHAVSVPFLLDIDVHVRFLIVVPLMIGGELVVHARTRAVVEQFTAQGLVPEALRGRFEAVLASALKLRNSVLAEVLLIAFVYTFGILVVWRSLGALDVSTWYAVLASGELQTNLAGWWYLLVSLPVFQFLLLRWYFRLFVWARLLWQLTRLPLAYAPMHPDLMGGIAFLATVPRAFAPLVFAQGAVVAGALANKILHQGAVLKSFVVEVCAVVAVNVCLMLGPLLLFVLPLAAARRTALRDYGQLARRYVNEFEAKWLRGGAPRDEALVGSSDLQSLADLGNSFATVRNMRLLPVTRTSLIQLVGMTVLPLLPLLLTVVSAEELFKRFIAIMF